MIGRNSGLLLPGVLGLVTLFSGSFSGRRPRFRTDSSGFLTSGRDSFNGVICKFLMRCGGCLVGGIARVDIKRPSREGLMAGAPMLMLFLVKRRSRTIFRSTRTLRGAPVAKVLRVTTTTPLFTCIFL
ncbi:MAG: hypothetical protein Q8P12_06070 [bacterium]|nr:hypothetical protein [bacterium]